MLVLARRVYDDVLDHARADAPTEACGVLSGRREERDDGVVAVAERAHPVPNAADAPRVTYELDPAEHLAVVEDVERAGRDVVGHYHSHPAGPPHMSETDRANATWTNYHYLLVSLGRPPSVDAWVWTGSEFVRDAVTVRE